MRLLEDWRKALDNYESVAAILMDLAKAFNSLHYDPLIAKLVKSIWIRRRSSYLSYFSDRSQQDIPCTSTCEKLLKRSITGINFRPVAFYVFLHDIFYFVLKSTIYIMLMTKQYLLFKNILIFLKFVLESGFLAYFPGPKKIS